MQQDEVGQKLQITEEEARQYYLAHQSEFVEPPTVTLREISVEIPTAPRAAQAGVNVAQDDEAKTEGRRDPRARDRRARTSARSRRRCRRSPSKANGGLIGPLPTKELSPAMHDLLPR